MAALVIATATVVLSAADGATASGGGDAVVGVLTTVPTTYAAPSGNSPYMLSDDDGMNAYATAPLFLDGGRRIAVVSFGSGHPSSSGTFVPGNGRVFVKAFGGCHGDVPASAQLSVDTTLNGVTIDHTSCSHTRGSVVATDPGIDDPDSDYSTIGVHDGVASTLAVSARVSPAATNVPNGSYAVYEQIPFAEAPLPPAPAALPPLPSPGSNRLLLDSRNSGQSGTWYVYAKAGATLELVRGGPGQLTVSYQGRQIGSLVGYDWGQDSTLVRLDEDTLGCGCGGRPPVPAQVRLTVHARDFTRPMWFVEDQRVPDPVPTIVFICSTDGPCSTSLSYGSVSPAT